MKLENPYKGLTGGQWLRGNLHTHTSRSDGREKPQAVINDYARRGYDFLMFADHDCPAGARDYKRLNVRGMVLVPGSEISANGSHMLHVNADRRIEPVAPRQRVLNDAARCRGFIIACHPNWHASFNHTSIDQLLEWTGYAGMEIFNGVIGRLEGSAYALDKWDRVLSAGRRVWGFANDDSHRAEDVELGWNMVYAKGRTSADVVAAMAAGRFYASTGVTIESIRVEGARVRVKTRDAQRIAAIMHDGKRFSVVDAGEIDVTVPEDARYVRFECWGGGERQAWTQPMFVRG